MQIVKIILLSLLITGCSKSLKLDVAPIEKAPLVLPQVDAYTPREVRFVLITKDNLDLVKKNGVVFALTTKGYEALALNTAAIQKLIKQLIARNKALSLYYQTTIPK